MDNTNTIPLYVDPPRHQHRSSEFSADLCFALPDSSCCRVHFATGGGTLSSVAHRCPYLNGIHCAGGLPHRLPLCSPQNLRTDRVGDFGRSLHLVDSEAIVSVGRSEHRSSGLSSRILVAFLRRLERRPDR